MGKAVRTRPVHGARAQELPLWASYGIATVGAGELQGNGQDPDVLVVSLLPSYFLF